MVLAQMLDAGNQITSEQVIGTQVTDNQALNIQNINIRDIDTSTLIDIKDIHIDTNLPKADRMRDVVRQMNGNPYFFKSGKIAVKVSFADTHVTLDERMESYLRTI